ncbi:MAG TPA: tyrosine--tRNA ligase [Candidatus Dormibacteraeota bacterium]|nr:tyrosine--tRNA ligase [Candidatus Dormibacteraeota bacterium]
MTPAAGLLRGVVDCVDRERLERRLNSGAELRIKFGVDPSAPDIHLGHTVPMRLLRRWQECGHLPILIIGDYTARIGDPTGRSVTRPQLTVAEVEENTKTYLRQLYSVVDEGRVELHYQSEWYGDFGLDKVLELARTTTVAQLLQRADFDQRMSNQQAIGVHELFYPLLQGYDSVAIRADVELGGTDQLFNLLRGREVQQEYGLAPQDIITVPLLVGLDGERKMSKSFGNAVAVAESADQQYGQLMSAPDSVTLRYLELLTDTDPQELAQLRAGLEAGTVHPRNLKAEMAARVVQLFHGEEGAAAAAAEFARVFRDKQLPANIPEVVLLAEPIEARDLLVQTKMATSRSEAGRLIFQGAVRIDEMRLESREAHLELRDGSILRVGPRRVVRLRIAPPP